MAIGPDAQEKDEFWMKAALRMAEQAASRGEVPVGAVVVLQNKQIGAGFNQPIGLTDASAHAEIVALRDSGAKLGNYRLPQTTVYVTLEPCMMCAGAMVHARVGRLVYGAVEPKAGAVVSHPALESAWLNHRIDFTGGVLADRCGALLIDFFAARRESS